MEHPMPESESSILEQAESLLRAWASAVAERPRLQEMVSNHDWTTEVYAGITEPASAADLAWKIEAGERLAAQAPAVAAARASLAALGQAEAALVGVGPRVAAVLEQVGIDSASINSLLLTLDPELCPAALLAIWRGKVRLGLPEPTAPAVPGPAAVDSEDLYVLCALASRHPLMMDQAALEAACYLGRGTISDRIRGLMAKGLVTRKGKRGGYSISALGVEVLKSTDLPDDARKILCATPSGRDLFDGLGKP
jgi:hypothetical protein